MYPIESRHVGRRHSDSGVKVSGKSESLGKSKFDQFYKSTRSLFSWAASAPHSFASALGALLPPEEVSTSKQKVTAGIDWRNEYHIKRSTEGKTSGVFFV